MPKFTYDFYECEDCGIGYAVEANEIAEPTCPACHCEHYRFVITRAFGPLECVVEGEDKSIE